MRNDQPLDLRMSLSLVPVAVSELAGLTIYSAISIIIVLLLLFEFPHCCNVVKVSFRILQASVAAANFLASSFMILQKGSGCIIINFKYFLQLTVLQQQ